MAYETDGKLTTDKKSGDSFGWDTQTEWEAYQSKTDIEISSGILQLATGIPDSAIAKAVATDYDGSQWVADIGPNISDYAGDPTKTTATIGGQSVDVVRFDIANNDCSRSTDTTFDLSGNSSQAIVYTTINTDPDPGVYSYYVDGGGSDEFMHGLNNATGYPHRIRSKDAGSEAVGDDADSNPHTFAIEGNGTTLRLLRDKTEILKASNGYDSLSGFSISVRGDGNTSYQQSQDMAEYVVLNNHTNTELNNEIDRQMNKYNL